MKTSVLTICLSLLLTGAWAQCPPGNIELKKGKRDWVKDYKNLKNKYKTKVTPLNAYFLDEKGIANKCIDYESFKKLVQAAKQVLGPLKLSNTGLLAQIERADKMNPNGFTKQKGKPGLPEPDAIRSESAQPATDVALIPADSASTDGQDPSTQEEQISQLNEDIKQLESDKQVWVWVSSLLGALFIGACGLLLWLTVFRKQRRRDSSRSQHDDGTADTSSHKSNSSINELYTQVKRLEKENASLNLKLAERLPAGNSQQDLQSDQPAGPGPEKEGYNPSGDLASEAGTVSPDAHPVANTFKEASLTASTPPVQFHLSTPTPTSDGMGTFSDKRQMQFDPIKSVYRFELTDRDGTQATFLFESSAGAVSGALDYPETYLQPACEYSGFDSRATRIVTDKKGQAVKEGDKWRVTHKAQIRFA